MKKLIIYMLMIVIVVTGTITITLSAVANSKSEQTITPAPLYVIKDYNGKVAVYKYNSNVPQETLEVYTNSLPEFDQKALHAGVFVYNETQLYKLIEDYES